MGCSRPVCSFRSMNIQNLLTPMHELPLRRDPVIEAYKRDVDVTLLLENLKLTPEQRLEKLQQMARFADELRRAGASIRRPS